MDLTESRALADRLASLLRHEHHALADFLAALAEFDRRRGWVELGYSGLFPFLQHRLGLSKGATYFRLTAARLIQRFPEIVEPLRDGRLCLTTVASLSKVLTAENRGEVLPRFYNRSKQEAAAIAAALCPEPSPSTRTVVTSVSVRGTALPSIVAPGPDRVNPVHLDEPRCPDDLGEAPSTAPAPPAPVRPMTVEPLTATQVRLHLTVTPEFLEKLEAVRMTLSHSMPGASVEQLITASFDRVLQRDAGRKGLVERPRPAPPEEEAVPGDPYIPAAVKRKVWERDGGCCAWPLDAGGVCGSRLRLQFDHVISRAEGGRSVVPNVRVLCAAHNKLAARERLGSRLMDRYCRDPRQGELGGLGRVSTARCPSMPPPSAPPARSTTRDGAYDQAVPAVSRAVAW